MANYIKKIFINNKNLGDIFLASFFSVLIIMLVFLFVLWHFRASVFKYFAGEYLASSQYTNSTGIITPKDIAQNAVEKNLTQEQLVIGTVKKTNPAVVSIIISKEVPKYETYTDPSQNQNPFGDLFPGFNFNIPQYKQNGTEKKEVGGGSGFFVSDDGLIVTNKHVVADKTALYTVITNDGKKHDAKVTARDPVLDIAIIIINQSPGQSFP